MTTPASICFRSITLVNEDGRLEFHSTGAVFHIDDDGETLVGRFTNPAQMVMVADFLIQAAKDMEADKGAQ
jgi:hypothetical protein